MEERWKTGRTEDGRMLLCGANSYEQKYYLNPRYASLPSVIQDELQIMAVTMTEDVGGVFTMEFDEDGSLYMSTTAKENDFFYDEIGSHLKIKQYRVKYAELLENLETYYKTFFIDGVNE